MISPIPVLDPYDTACDVIALAQAHYGKGSMVSSAEVCLDDAEDLTSAGRFREGARRALRSLAYSVGAAHSDYKRAEALVRACR